jgi:V/A-type H+/Na+-transporting ATPase subunit K
MNAQQRGFKHRVSFSVLTIALLMTFISLFFTLPLHGAETGTDVQVSAGSTITAADAERQKWGLMAAALAFGLGAIGAGLAIAKVGAAAMGAMSERPEVGGQALIFVAMAEGIVIFGFISALMILGKF